MELSKQLRDLRKARGFSQGDIEARTGLLRCYVSRVENGHTLPSLGTLERWATGLGVEVYEVFVQRTGSLETPSPKRDKRAMPAQPPREQELLTLFNAMDSRDRALLLSLAECLEGWQNMYQVKQADPNRVLEDPEPGR